MLYLIDMHVLRTPPYPLRPSLNIQIFGTPPGNLLDTVVDLAVPTLVHCFTFVLTFLFQVTLQIHYLTICYPWKSFSSIFYSKFEKEN